MAMQRIQFEDEHGTAEIALTPKSGDRLFLAMAKRYAVGWEWKRGPDAMLTKDQAVWMRDQLAAWLKTLDD